jgi:hypothetical protein
VNNKIFGSIIVVVAILGGVWFYFGSGAAPYTPSNKEFVLQLKDANLVAGPNVLTVQQGDTVTIKITADAEEEFHLHGYDRSVDLVPDQEVSLTFVADLSGRFPYELEKSKIEIGALEVFPQ